MDEMKTFREMTELEWKSVEFQFCLLHHVFELKYDGIHNVRCVAGSNRVDHAQVEVRATSVQSTNVKFLLLASIRQQH